MIDCHQHLQDLQFQADLNGIMATLEADGVSQMVVNGTHPGDWGRVEDLSLRYSRVIPSFGLHPWRVNEAPGAWSEVLEAFLLRHPLAGVGEIGLDKWIRGCDFDRQREVFSRQLEVAQRLRRPVSIHCLRAWGSLRKCLDQSPLSDGWLLHSYSGPPEMVGDFTKRGAFFSLSGYFFRPEKEEKLRVFKKIPDDRILLETDAPDMMPPRNLVKYPRLSTLTGESVNHPANISLIYEAYAAWRGIPIAEAINRMRENFRAWFFAGDRKRFAGPANETRTPN